MGERPELESDVQAIRDEYRRRAERRPPSSPGSAMFSSRMDYYEQALRSAGMLPLRGRRILDLGCNNGKWLTICCERWGAEPENCFGLDVLEAGIEKWKATYPDSKLTLACVPAHEMAFEDGSIDLIHHSMMFSSICSADLRKSTAARMWRALKPGGCVLWYDFWINPFNRRTVSMHLKDISSLFPRGKLAFRRTISLAAPLCRSLRWAGDGFLLALQALRVLNTHHLVVVVKN